MHRLVEELESLTKQFVDTIDAADYESIPPFLDRREAIIDQLGVLKWTAEQKAEHQPALDRIRQMDRLISARIVSLRDEARSNLQKFDHARMQKSAYEVTVAADGAYFDRRIGKEYT